MLGRADLGTRASIDAWAVGTDAARGTSLVTVTLPTVAAGASHHLRRHRAGRWRALRRRVRRAADLGRGDPGRGGGPDRGHPVLPRLAGAQGVRAAAAGHRAPGDPRPGRRALRHRPGRTGRGVDRGDRSGLPGPAHPRRHPGDPGRARGRPGDLRPGPVGARRGSPRADTDGHGAGPVGQPHGRPHGDRSGDARDSRSRGDDPVGTDHRPPTNRDAGPGRDHPTGGHRHAGRWPGADAHHLRPREPARRRPARPEHLGAAVCRRRPRRHRRHRPGQRPRARPRLPPGHRVRGAGRAGPRGRRLARRRPPPAGSGGGPHRGLVGQRRRPAGRHRRRAGRDHDGRGLHPDRAAGRGRGYPADRLRRPPVGPPAHPLRAQRRAVDPALPRRDPRPARGAPRHAARPSS